MDLLAYPNDAQVPPIEVPYICGDLLKNVCLKKSFSFIAYLKSLPPCSKWYPANEAEAASKAQAHLFFGILQEHCDSDLAIDDFIRPSNQSGTKVISLKVFKENFRFSWMSRHGADYGFKNIIFNHVRYLRSLGELGDVVGLSIEVLIWAIFRISWPARNKALSDRMLLAGWCPYWTNVYCHRYASPILYVLSGTNRIRHPSCTAEGPCKFYDTHKETYRTRHASNCIGQDCRFVGPEILDPGSEGVDLRQLGDIIDRGGIPLIRFRELPNISKKKADKAKSVVEVDIVEYTFGRPFVAVSHVWAGGLGNMGTNKLPQCQIEYLYKHARKCEQKNYGVGVEGLLGEDLNDDDDFMSRFMRSGIAEDTSILYVWIDTLCIPADERLEGLKDLKSKSIDRMAEIYALAMHTLVIDHEVKDLPPPSEDSNLALTVGFVTCPWMCRSWTFQEACLSRKFSFAVSDEVVDPRNLRRIRKSTGYNKSWVDELFSHELIYSQNMPDVLNLAARQGSNVRSTDPLVVVSNFIQVWNELATRRTTYQEDLHGIFAALLGLSVQEILRDNGRERHPSERMRAIIKSQSCLPLSMLFSTYPKNTEPCTGYESESWLPQFPTGSLQKGMGTMSWSTDGTGLQFTLNGTRTALIVDGLLPRGSRGLPVKHQEGVLSEEVYFELTANNNFITFTLTEYKAQAITWDQQFCFLLHPSGLGACFHLIEDTEEFMRLKYICPITFAKKKKNDDGGEGVSSNQDARDKDVNYRWKDNAACFVDCDSSNWPTPIYRRLLQTPKQYSLTKPIGTYIFLHWAILAISLILDSRWTFYSTIPNKYIRQFLDRIPLLPLTLGLINAYYPVRFLFPLSILIFRLLIFLLEDTRFEALAQRVRYQRLAHSFEFVPVSDLRKSARLLSRRLYDEPSYQFPRCWLLAVPLSFAGICWLQKKLIVWIFEPVAGQVLFNAEIAMIVVKGIIWEIPGRIIVEFIWRYFRLDLEISE